MGRKEVSQVQTANGFTWPEGKQQRGGSRKQHVTNMLTSHTFLKQTLPSQATTERICNGSTKADQIAIFSLLCCVRSASASCVAEPLYDSQAPQCDHSTAYPSENEIL